MKAGTSFPLYFHRLFMNCRFVFKKFMATGLSLERGGDSLVSTHKVMDSSHAAKHLR